MIFGSVCSGIEAASAAWIPLGWRPAWFAEVSPFPSAVLAHHHPEVPNYADFTALLSPDHPRASVDVLVGGTPCQSFSVAGLRGGLSDPRGNLALAFVLLVGVLRPRWVVWENVPGVLSIDGGRAFGSILGGLADLGYGWAYRVLDAQYFGLAQRRKRVFVVASPGDWRRAAQVLFEPEGVRRDSPPRREAGARVASGLGTGASDGGGWRVGADEAAGGQVVPEGFGDVEAYQCHGSNVGPLGTFRKGSGSVTGGVPFVAYNVHGGNANARERHAYPTEVARCVDSFGGFAPNQGGTVVACPVISPALKARDYKGPSSDGDGDGMPLIAHSLRAEGHDASEDGTGRGVPLVPVAMSVQEDKQNGVTVRDVAGSVRATAPGSQPGGSLAFEHRGVRRLMPVEAERLQGFPDGYTRIPRRGRPAEECPDGPRYKALGNSMAVPCMAWIGRRIALVDKEPR